jgi:hypothetical protein
MKKKKKIKEKKDHKKQTKNYFNPDNYLARLLVLLE